MPESILATVLDELGTAMVVLHFLAFAVGVGAATLTDVLVLRLLLRHRIRRASFIDLCMAHRVIAVALAAVWVTGLVNVWRLWLTAPEALAHPKVWVKTALVVVISINGYAIQKWCLPWVRRRIGKSLLGDALAWQRYCLAASGAISATSWFFVLALGATPRSELGFSYGELFGFWGLCLIAAFTVASIMMQRTNLMVRPAG